MTITYVSDTWEMKRADQNQAQTVHVVIKNIFSNYLIVDRIGHIFKVEHHKEMYEKRWMREYISNDVRPGWFSLK